MEYFNLNWLANAFTEARRPGKHFYYDTHTEQFFSVVQEMSEDTPRFYNMIELEMSGAEYDDLMLRFLTYPEEQNGTTELPRLKEEEKKQLQWGFLAPFDGNQYDYEYHKAIENQTDVEGFILDQVIVDDDPALKSLWEGYKLATIAKMIKTFAACEGLEIDLKA